MKSQGGMFGVLGAILGVFVLFLVLGKFIPAIWPAFVGSGSDVAALTQTDAATEFVQSFWPIGLLVVGIAVGIAVVVIGIRFLSKHAHF